MIYAAGALPEGPADFTCPDPAALFAARDRRPRRGLLISALGVERREATPLAAQPTLDFSIRDLCCRLGVVAMSETRHRHRTTPAGRVRL